MIALSRAAERDIDALLERYFKCERPLAAKGLLGSINQSAGRIESSPDSGLPAPRPYPALARPDRRWLKQGAYWIAYTTDHPPIIDAIFHERADIPGRFRAAGEPDGT